MRCPRNLWFFPESLGREGQRLKYFSGGLETTTRLSMISPTRHTHSTLGGTSTAGMLTDPSLYPKVSLALMEVRLWEGGYCNRHSSGLGHPAPPAGLEHPGLRFCRVTRFGTYKASFPLICFSSVLRSLWATSSSSAVPLERISSMVVSAVSPPVSPVCLLFEPPDRDSETVSDYFLW